MWEDQFFSNERFVAKNGSFQDSYFSFDYFYIFVISLFMLFLLKGVSTAQKTQRYVFFFFLNFLRLRSAMDFLMFPRFVQNPPVLKGA